MQRAALLFLWLVSAPNAQASQYPYLDCVRDGFVAASAYALASSGKLVQLESSGFRSGKIQVAITQRPEPADLVVFLPGMQQGFSHPYSKIAAKVAAQVGHHFLAIPAPFSDEYRATHPKHVPGTALEEARIVGETILRVIEKIGAQQVKKVRIVGLSYGAFLASVVAAKALEEKIPLGNLVLVSPPAHLGEIAFRLDTLMDRNLIPFDPIYGWKDVTYAALPSLSGTVGEERAAKAFAWVFYTDQKVIVEYLQKEFACDWRPGPDQVRFWPTVRNCSPQNEAFLKGPTAGLAYWVPKIPQSVRITSLLSFLDPFVNFEQAERSLKARMNFWEIPKEAGSGHNGFLTTTEFQRKLALELQRP